MDKNYTSVTIDWEQYYGLRLKAAENDPNLHTSQKLSEILKKAGVPRIGKDVFNKVFDDVKSHKMTLDEVLAL